MLFYSILFYSILSLLSSYPPLTPYRPLPTTAACWVTVGISRKWKVNQIEDGHCLELWGRLWFCPARWV